MWEVFLLYPVILSATEFVVDICIMFKSLRWKKKKKKKTSNGESPQNYEY